MNTTTPPQVLRFGVFELDTTSGELRRHGLKTRLPDQSFQILQVLLSRPGEAVTRDELRLVLWPADTFVDFEVGLNSAVWKLREALDDSAENPRFIETLPRRGYRFVGSVSGPELEAAPLSTLVTREPSVAASEAVVGQASEHGMGPAAAEDSLAPAPAVITPQRARVSWRVGGLLIVPLVVVSTVMYVGGGSPPPDPIRVVVVLPFENLTGDAGQDYVVDSVTEAVTTQLAQVAGLDVISRMSARQYKNSAKRPRLIAQELGGVDGVVSGTVVKSATGMDITVHLIRAASERDVWARTYQSDPSHMIGLQQRMASEIAVAAGRPALARGGIATTQTVVPQAYDAYLKGLTAQGQVRYEGFRRAVAYFEQAVAIQPDFAQAHADMAFAQLQFLFDGPLSPHEAIPKAEAAARRALQLDDTLARPHVVLGQILLLYHWRKEEGEAALDRAAKLQGAGGNEITAITNALTRRGRFTEAIAAAERARRLDPLSLGAQVAVGTAYRSAGQYDRAIDELRRALEISPGRPRVHFQLGVTFVGMGRFADAIRELEIAARPSEGHLTRHEAYLGYAYAAAGRSDDARAVLQELESHRRELYVSSFGIALIHDALGEQSQALAALERAYQDHAVEFGLEHYPPFKAIAAEPRFQHVMRQVER
jgi:TolB-like protein/DNA-binding winged helix-turn-helix (wHTH) protein/Flp pilus assembly protein TadD